MQKQAAHSQKPSKPQKHAAMQRSVAGAAIAPKALAPAIQIFLCGNPNAVDCRFWMGLTQKGDLTPQQLLDLPDVQALFLKAAVSGIQEAPPLMLSDTSRVPPRSYFIMNPPSNNEPERAEWVDHVVDALKSWSPPRAGFIMSPKLLELPSSRELLVKVIEKVSTVSQTKQFFFSVENHGFNSGLNAMLTLKAELEERGVRVHVFH